MGNNKMKSFTYTELKMKSLSFAPLSLAKELGFEGTLSIARSMLFNEEWDESLQEYATNLLEWAREIYPEKWNPNWKYDAFLGHAYDITLKYDERYAAYKRAFDKVALKPPQLLIALAHCSSAPGPSLVTEEEAILLVKEAIKTTPYIEGIELLRGLYKSQGNIKEQMYWENILEKTKDHGPHLPSLDF
jgi:hypothetical protein